MKELYAHGNWFTRRIVRPLQNAWAMIKTQFRKAPVAHGGSAIPPFVGNWANDPFYDVGVNPDFKEAEEAVDELAKEDSRFHERK